MAETRAPLCRTLAAIPLAAALAGCAATHVGDDWQCPLAQGEVCTSIAAADPAIDPERAPPALATRTPLYRTSDRQAAAPETEPATGTNAGTETRPCAEGCSPFAWLGRVLAPRGAAAGTAENAEAVSAVPPAATPVRAGTSDTNETSCGAGESAREPTAAPVDTEDGAPCPIAAEAQAATTPAPIASAEPIAPSTAAVIPCETDEALATPAEPVEADGTTGASVAEDAETPCAGPASAEETVAAEPTEIDEHDVPIAETTTPPPAAESTSPTAAALLPPPPAPDALRTGEVVGRIWIAPFVDAGGVYREGAWVRAVLAPAEWRR